MKFIYTFLLAMACLFTATAQENKGASDPKSEALLKQLGAKYKGYTTMRAVFINRIESAESDIDETRTGKIYIKGHKFKLETDEFEIVCDNNTRWIYLKDANEVQIKHNSNGEEDINPSELFTLYEKGFISRIKEESVEAGKRLTVVELTPTDKKKPYFKVLLWVDKTANEIVRAKIFNKNQVHFTYEIQKFVANLELSDDYFSFDPAKYKGIEIVDLR